MAPTTASNNEPKAGPAQAGKEPKGASAADVNFIFNVLKHNRVKLDVDWEAFAKDVGYNSGNTAHTRYGQIRKKLGFSSEKPAPTAGGGAAGSPAAATRKVTKRPPKARAKAKNTAAANLAARDAMIEQALQPNDADFDRDVDMDLTPTPAGRTKDALKAEADDKDDVDDDEADF